MRKTYEYRVRPTPAQERRLVATLDACRHVYNWAIEDRKALWQYAKCWTSFYDQSGYLKHLKTERPWLTEVYSHPLQDALRRVDRAFAAFFRRVKAGQAPGYPRFRGRDGYDSFTFKEWGRGCGFDGRRLALGKIGRLRIVLHRPIVGTIKTCTLKRRADGWYALFAVECADVPLRAATNPVGVDVGLTTFAALSTGELITNPRHAKVAAQDVARAQRIVSKRQRGSVRRGKARDVLARRHLRLARTRRNFHFQVAHDLATRFNPIIVEDLHIAGMARHPTLAASIHDAGWGQFLGILAHSAENAGAAYMAVEARGTSQTCSACGVVVPKTLAERTHRCAACGLVMDRDVNAACVVLKRGLDMALGEATHAAREPRSRAIPVAAECHPGEPEPVARRLLAPGPARNVQKSGRAGPSARGLRAS